jgi:branched-chain amino acid transport system substrate-binding protein
MIASPQTSPLERARRAVQESNDAAGSRSTGTVKIGILTPLSLPGYFTAGELIVRGACLAAEYVRERGGLPDGRQIELLVEDDQATAAAEGMQRSAVAGLAKLAMVDEVLAVIGQWHLRTTPWVVEMSERLGVPIFVANSHNTITARQRRTLFRTYFANTDRVPLMLRFARELGVRRMSILAASTVFGLQIADTLEEQNRSLGCDFEVLRHEFHPDTAEDVRDTLREHERWGPDIVMNVGVPVTIGTCFIFINQTAEVGLRPRVPMMVGFGFPANSQDYWRRTGENGNGVMWAASRYRPSWPGMTAIGRWLTERHLERYGGLPSEPTLNAFTDAAIIAQAAGGAGDGTREALLDALESGAFETWRGPVHFERRDDHWHHSPPELVLLQYQEVGQGLDEAAIVYPPESRTKEYVAPCPSE